MRSLRLRPQLVQEKDAAGAITVTLPSRFTIVRSEYTDDQGSHTLPPGGAGPLVTAAATGGADLAYLPGRHIALFEDIDVDDPAFRRWGFGIVVAVRTVGGGCSWRHVDRRQPAVSRTQLPAGVGYEPCAPERPMRFDSSLGPP